MGLQFQLKYKKAISELTIVNQLNNMSQIQ